MRTVRRSFFGSSGFYVHGLSGRRGERGVGMLVYILILLASTITTVTFFGGRLATIRAQQVKTLATLNEKLFMSSVMDYMKNSVVRHWCLNDILIHENNAQNPCDLTHRGNTERLLFSESVIREIKEKVDASTPPQTIFKPANSPQCAAVRDQSLCYGDSSRPEPDLKEIIFDDVNVSGMSAQHELKILMRNLKINDLSNLYVSIRREKPRLGGSEVVLKFYVKAKYGSLLLGGYHESELTSVAMAFPRELSTFALIMRGDLVINSQNSQSQTHPGSLLAPRFTRKMLSEAGTFSGLFFKSPVFFNRDLILPNTPAPSLPSDQWDYYPVTFEDVVRLGAGNVYRNGVFETSAGGGAALSRSPFPLATDPLFGGIVGGVLLDGGLDRGLDYLFEGGQAPNESLLARCVERGNLKRDLTLTENSVPAIRALPDVPGGFSYEIGLTQKNEFREASLYSLPPQVNAGSPLPVNLTLSSSPNDRELTAKETNPPNTRPVAFATIEIDDLKFSPGDPTQTPPIPESRLPASVSSIPLAWGSQVKLSFISEDRERLKSDQDDLKADDSLDKTLSDLQTELITAQGQLPSDPTVTVDTTLTDQINRLNTQITDTQAKIAAKAQKITGLQNQIDSTQQVDVTFSFQKVSGDRAQLSVFMDPAKASIIPNYFSVQLRFVDFGALPDGSGRSDGKGPNALKTTVLKFTKTGTAPSFSLQPTLVDVDVDPDGKPQESNPRNVSTSKSLLGHDASSAQLASFNAYDFSTASYDPAQLDRSCNTSAGGGTAFGFAGWAADFSATARKSFNFNPPAAPPGGQTTFVFDRSTNNTFVTQSVVNKCIIKSNAMIAAGFLTCDTLEIKPRSTPLWIIGTFIVDNVILPNDLETYRKGIRWSSIYHPAAITQLKNYRILPNVPPSYQGIVCPEVSRNDARNTYQWPVWHPDPGAYLSQLQYLCSSESLRNGAVPFTWTSVTPVCGLVDGAAATTCRVKGRMINLQLVEAYRK